MDTSEHTRNQNSLQTWYEYAIQQNWAVDAYLRLVRLHDFKTQEQQRNEFGATPEEFLHLQAMHSPRENFFAIDARRIAQARHLHNPDAFVQTMLFARQLAFSAQTSTENDTYYQAAFDAVGDLDSDIPEDSGDE
jgi:hypothetical protein